MQRFDGFWCAFLDGSATAITGGRRCHRWPHTAVFYLQAPAAGHALLKGADIQAEMGHRAVGTNGDVAPSDAGR